MSDDIPKYIENEKDISRCKIAILESIGTLSPAKRRIFELEKGFVEFPFENLGFKTRIEAEQALLLYRSYKNLFYKKYHLKISFKTSRGRPDNPGPKFSTSALRVYRKIKYIKKSAEQLTSARIQEVNFVQDEGLFGDLVKFLSKKNDASYERVASDISSKDLDYFSSIEPVYLAKKRAKMQIILFSIGTFLRVGLSFIEKLEVFDTICGAYGDLSSLSMNKKSLVCDNIIQLENSLDDLIESVEENIFKYYNSSISALSHSLTGTMGYNKYLVRSHCLVDIVKLSGEKFPIGIFIDGDLIDSVGIANILMARSKISSTDDFLTKYTNKSHGIIFPIKRVGNEKLHPLYIKIFIGDNDITYLFNNKFSNITAQDSNGISAYYKALMTKPLSEIYEFAKLSDSARSMFLRLMGNETNYDLCDLFSDDFILNINNKNGNFIPIDMERSNIYASKTRSDGDMIIRGLGAVADRVESIKLDYYNIGYEMASYTSELIRNRMDEISAYGKA